MQSNKGRDTTPELAIRRRLHALGLRYRVSVRPVVSVRRTADVVFTRAKVAVFIDGCYWHGCPVHYQAPARNAEFWLAKKTRNQVRDAETTALLQAQGWRVMRFWEHDVKSDPDAVTHDVHVAVREAGLIGGEGGAPRTRSRNRAGPGGSGAEATRPASS